MPIGLEPVFVDGEIVSSSRVRKLLSAGRVDDARRMLTRPGVGVYAGLGLAQGRHWPAAINVGPNPMFGEHALKVEVHSIGFQGSLYGEPQEADFLSRIRDVRPFGSVDELKSQLARDLAAACSSAVEPTRDRPRFGRRRVERGADGWQKHGWQKNTAATYHAFASFRAIVLVAKPHRTE